MEILQDIKIAEGWNVRIVRDGPCYRIERIQALLGYIWLTIDTSKFTEKQWVEIHALVAKGEEQNE